MSRSDTTSGSTLLISFLTTQDRYALPNVGYSVPASSTRMDLDQMVNGMLRDSGKFLCMENVAFDFTIENVLLRSPLNEHIANYNISPEKQIEVHYFVATLTPEPNNVLQHDDWVSAVDVQNDWILSGSYDGSVHIWSPDGKHHNEAKSRDFGEIKGVSWIDFTENNASFVSVSHTQTGTIWQWNNFKNDPYQVGILRGHENSIECVAVNNSKEKLATGSWDTMVKIWSTEVNGSQQPRKKSKVDDDVNTELSMTPILTLKGHRGRVSEVQWIANDLLSVSWDHTIKIWDIECSSIKNEIVGNRAFNTGHQSKLNNLILASGAECQIKLFDPRKDTKVADKVFQSHRQWVSAVKWSSVKENLFISSSFDSCVKMWDIRSENTPLFDLIGHNDKVLCLSWSQDNLIASGGKDCTLRLYKSIELSDLH